MNESDILAFIKHLPIFNGLSPEDLKLIALHLETKKLLKDEILFEELENSNYVCILYSGELIIFKNDKENKFQITHLMPGEVFGEMALLDESKRSATIKAAKDSILFIFNRQLLNENDHIKNIILSNIAKVLVPRLRHATDQLVISLKKEINELQERTLFGKVFIWFMIVFGLGGLMDSLAKKSNVNIESELYNWSYLLIVSIPILIIMRIYKYSLRDSGVNLNQWKQSLIEGAIISGCIVSLYVLLVKPFFFDLLPVSRSPRSLNQLGFVFLFYLPNAYIQELITRGITQSILQQFYADVRGIKSVIVTSLIFGIFHFHIGLVTSLVVFICSIFFGFIYIRTRNLIGVSLVHYTAGIIGMLLGFL